MSDAVNPDHYKQLPAEAIEIIESAIDKAPSKQGAYLHGQVLKYILRCWNKNGIEDLRKAKWYLDRLIGSFEANEPEQPATVEVTGEVTGEVAGEVEPPDGWRFLEVGEVIRKGDVPFENGQMYGLEPIKIGMTLQEHWKPMIRRNRFNAGEKVVHLYDNPPVVYIVDVIRADGAIIAYNNGIGYAFGLDNLAPYIEETK